jgi:glyoxylase-like metal-dependent hydrolase (beta-lactamase superfamily II)
LIDHPEGRLVDYFRSLDRLQGLGDVLVLPGHGPVGATCVERASAILQHRRDRLAEVRSAWSAGAMTAPDLVRAVYGDLEPPLARAAQRNVEAALEYLQNVDPDG